MSLHLRLIGPLCLALIISVTAFNPAQAGQGLRILLTNDDGFDAPGLTILRTALLEAGHDVTTVAPSGNRSGSSASITARGVLTLTRHGPSIYAIDGTPFDCVQVALNYLMETPPDLVISGVNFGQNVGPAVLLSGTIGAARSAQMSGIPAIAASQAYDPQEPSKTMAYFPDAAAAVVRLVAILRKDDGLLTPDSLFNINTPLRHEAEVTGWRITSPASSMRVGFDYSEGEPGTVQVSIKLDGDQAIPEGTDVRALMDGAISITALSRALGEDKGLEAKLAGQLTEAVSSTGE